MNLSPTTQTPKSKGRGSTNDFLLNAPYWIEALKCYDERRYLLYCLILKGRTDRVSQREACEAALMERDVEAHLEYFAAVRRRAA